MAILKFKQIKLYTFFFLILCKKFECFFLEITIKKLHLKIFIVK